MIERLIQIPGEQFLVIYLIYCAAILLIYYSLKKRILSFVIATDYRKLELSGLETLILTQGTKFKNIIVTIFMSLVERKFVHIEVGKAIAIELKPNDELSEIENKILQYFKTSNTPQSILKDAEFKNQFEKLIASKIEKFEAIGLCISKEHQIKLIKIFCILFFIMLTPGLMKLHYGLLFEKPVEYLTLLLVFATIAFIFAYPREKLTSIANDFISVHRFKYYWAKQLRKNRFAFPPEADPLMAAGLFGAGFLMFFPEYENFWNYFPSEHSNSDFFPIIKDEFFPNISPHSGFNNVGFHSSSNSNSGGSSSGGGCGGCGGGGGGG